MTALFSHTRVSLLTDEDKPVLLDLLQRDAPETVYLRSMAHEYPVSPTQDPGHGRFFGAFDGGDLKTVAFLGNSHNLCTHGDARYLEPLLRRAEKAPVRPQLFVGPEEHAEHVRRFFSQTGLLPKLDRRQYAYVFDGPEVQGDTSLTLRPAGKSDLAQVVDAHAAMIEEDLQIERGHMNMTRLKTITRRRMEQGRIWVHEDHGRLVFKTEEISRSSEGVLVGGVYTHPDFRGRGFATRGMAAWAAILFASHIRRLALHVDADNVPAIKAYENVGFVRRQHLRLILCM